MNCHRCNGLMYQMELRDAKGFDRLVALVCVLCGDMIDPVIALNRGRRVALEVRLPKRAPRHGNYWKKLRRSMPGAAKPERELWP